MVKHSAEKQKEVSDQLNKEFTILQNLDKKISSWKPLSKNAKEKLDQVLLFSQIEIQKEQTKIQKKQNKFNFILAFGVLLTGTYYAADLLLKFISSESMLDNNPLPLTALGLLILIIILGVFYLFIYLVNMIFEVEQKKSESTSNINKQYDYLKFNSQFWATITIGFTILYWTLVTLEKELPLSFMTPIVSSVFLIYYYLKFRKTSEKYLEKE